MTSKAPSAAPEAALRTANAESSSSSSAPRFPSILVARSNKTRPSELEVFLRSHCGKMKVSPRLSGAHMILQNKDSSSNIAVRCYYPMDLQRLEESQNNGNNETPPPPPFQLQQRPQDVDGIQAFVRHFQWSVIFFILPTNHYSDQIRDDNSFLRQVMRLLDDTSLVEQEQQQQQQLPLQYSHRTLHETKSSIIKNPSRLVIRSTTEQAIDYLVSLTDALKPAKHKLRQEFFHRQEQLHFGPNATGSVVTGVQSRSTNSDDKAVRDRNAAAHAVTTFRELADSVQFPPGEADLLLRLIGQNSTLTSLVSTVNKNNSLPMEEQSKDILERFFGTTDSPGHDEGPSGRNDQAHGWGVDGSSSSNFGTDYQSMIQSQTFPGNPTDSSYGHPQMYQAQDQAWRQKHQNGSESMYPGQNRMQRPNTQAPPWNEESRSGPYNFQNPSQVPMMPPHQTTNNMPMPYGRPSSNSATYNYQQQQQQHAAPPSSVGLPMMGRFPTQLNSPFPQPSGNTQYVVRGGPFPAGQGGSYHHYHHQSTMQ